MFGDRIVEYLLAGPHRLDIGYSSWGSGNGIAAISREAVKNASIHCSEVNFQRLEFAILDFYPPFERENPKRLGYTQYLLLNALAERRRSDNASRRFQELARKFRTVELGLPTSSGHSGFVGSPIHQDAAKKMSDDQWLSAIRAYPDPEPSRAHEGDFLKGGSVELSRELEEETKQNKIRFAALALRMEPDIQPVYFEAILRGLVASQDSATKPSAKDAEISPVETETAVKVIRHVSSVLGAKGGRWICYAIGKLADRELPEDLLDIVGSFAQNDPDPEAELSRPVNEESRRFYSSDPLGHGINTTRGGAADAIGHLLLSDHRRFDRLKPAVLAAISDPSPAVRACAVHCLLAMLNFEPELAVNLFLRSIDEAESILGTAFVERFLYYAVFTYYGALRALLLKMLSCPDEDVRKIAAQQIALASFSSDEAKSDVAAVLIADEVCRTAVATVDAENLKLDECAPTSRARLKRFFSDESSEVRAQAALCFLRISDEQLCHEAELIDSFLESPAFESNTHILLMALKGSAARLPDVVCRIAERAAELHRTTTSNELRWWTGEMATLVLRLYEQTGDPMLKRRCLDVIDSMIELNFGGAGFELAKLES